MTRVTWWLGRGSDPDVFQRNFVDPYRASDPPVDLHVEYLGADSPERTLAALADGTAPDIVMIPRAGTFARLARKGHFADLSGYEWTGRLLPLAREIGTHGGRLLGIPRSSETMLLFYEKTLFATHAWQPPRTLGELETLATAMQARGIVPFGAGSADVPQSVELYFSLIVNHHAGPANVRKALLGERPWTTFTRSVALLREWFERGWFGENYFTDTYTDGFARIATGEAGMSPNMTWVFGDIPAAFGERAGNVGVTPFPTPWPAAFYVYGTGSLIGINAKSAAPDAAAAVLDNLFTNDVRRSISQDLPGDWNLPLTDPDADGLAACAMPQFAETAVALTSALQENRFGYSTWSFFPPTAEEAVITNFRDMIEGRMTVESYLTAIDEAFVIDRTAE
ncbi:ABC transporter substrate-binding protein [Paractinoplanes durhamensis]|uniref:ABC transporter substrate-binding protein n=1 Tax=Paractinoplanes durhamensis TaxID=113563 RepID=A0ABQ3YQG5_9ACTN|nr:extracellular solute-binding protein [Actinoplanes durhamensis]GID99801.1 ABC transporter substrate-binding protein [Actinoplanes durhamensis]